MWELNCEESWALKNWCFWTLVLEKTLESPMDCKEIQPVHSKGDQSWMFFGRNDAKAETPVLWPPHAKIWLIGKDSDAGRDWGQEEKRTTEDEMAGWHHQLNGCESQWTLGVGDGQGGLACCNSWDRKESDTTEWLNWTELRLSWALTFLLQMWSTDQQCLITCDMVRNAEFQVPLQTCWIRIWKDLRECNLLESLRSIAEIPLSSPILWFYNFGLLLAQKPSLSMWSKFFTLVFQTHHLTQPSFQTFFPLCVLIFRDLCSFLFPQADFGYFCPAGMAPWSLSSCVLQSPANGSLSWPPCIISTYPLCSYLQVAWGNLNCYHWILFSYFPI